MFLTESLVNFMQPERSYQKKTVLTKKGAGGGSPIFMHGQKEGGGGGGYKKLFKIYRRQKLYAADTAARASTNKITLEKQLLLTL